MEDPIDGTDGGGPGEDIQDERGQIREFPGATPHQCAGQDDGRNAETDQAGAGARTENGHLG